MPIISISKNFSLFCLMLLVGGVFASDQEWVAPNCSAKLSSLAGGGYIIKYEGETLEGVRGPRWLSASDHSACLMNYRDGAEIGWIFFVRTPSVKNQGTGFCGAGHEDRLVYFYKDGTRAKFGSDILVQSCLKSLDLLSDNPEDEKKTFQINDERHELKFFWLDNGEKKIVRVVNSRIEMAD